MVLAAPLAGVAWLAAVPLLASVGTRPLHENDYHLEVNPALRVRDLSVRYGSNLALDRVSLEVPAGSSVAVLGPNGSGKSTLFSALLGIAPARGAAVTFAQHIAYVPQGIETDRAFPATVRDVVRMGRWSPRGWLSRLTAVDHALVDEAIDALGISHLAGESFGALSGGERKRALLAQAVAADAPLLLLDEPFTGVDRPTLLALERLIASWAGEGRTVLVATHDLEGAASYDLVACLNRRLVAFGPPDQALTEDVLRETFSGHIARVGDTVIETEHHHHGAG